MIIPLLLLSALPVNKINEWKGNVVFSDEFDGTSLNNSIWDITKTCKVNKEQEQCYTKSPRNIIVKDGLLTLKIIPETIGSKRYTSAKLTTKQKFTYGTFVFRAKLPYGKNLQPALWLSRGWGSDKCKYEEIDILEQRGQQPNYGTFSAHFGRNKPKLDLISSKNNLKLHADMSLDFHEFTLSWNSSTIAWYIDKVLYKRVSLNSVDWLTKKNEPCSADKTPFNDPMEIIVNVAVGGNSFFNRKVDSPLKESEAKKWPKPFLEIDWIRVYQ